MLGIAQVSTVSLMSYAWCSYLYHSSSSYYIYTLAVYCCAGNVVNSVSVTVAVIIIIRVLNVHISRPCLLSMHMFIIAV